MHGLDRGDPACLHSPEDVIRLVDEVGFLPLFRNGIKGFSLEEHTCSDDWWCGDPKLDPWEWRAIITNERRLTYGKFFDNKAGFISLAFLPDFINARRDGYDFDARWDDEKASTREKRIMDLYAGDHAGDEIYSPEIKKRAGFGKGGEKGFETALTKLQMQLYLCPIAFKQRVSKTGDAFGWSIAVFSTPEHIWGEEFIKSAYQKSPEDSAKAIARKMIELYPDLAPAKILRIAKGSSAGVPKERKRKKKEDYPINLLKDIDINRYLDKAGITLPEMDYDAPTSDQLLGLEYALGLLKEKSQEALRLRYEKQLTYKEVGELMDLSSARANQLCTQALMSLRIPATCRWYVKGVQACREERKTQVAKIREKLEAKTGRNLRAELAITPLDMDIGYSVMWSLEKAGIMTIGELLVAMQEKNWYQSVPGIGLATSHKLERLLQKRGLYPV